MNGAADLISAGERLWLHPQRAVIWPRGGAVIVADTHFGKSSAFARHGFAVPAGADDSDRARLSQLLDACSARRLIVLGDFLHEPLSEESEEARDLEIWCKSLSGVHLQVIAGNHDRGVSRGWRGPIEWIEGELHEPPFRLMHDCSAAPRGSGFSLSGHVHPVAALEAFRKRRARVPAFWLREHGLVLPSFGAFTGGYLVKPARGERLFAVSPDRVVPFPVVA
jgi:DNA ligase-associated metallophosphoesterase